VSNEVQTDLAGLQSALLKTDSVEQFLHELAVLAPDGWRGRGTSCGWRRQRAFPRPRQ
jgi:hypothetical protein